MSEQVKQDVQADAKQGELERWTMHHVKATCGICGAEDEVGSPSRAGMLRIYTNAGWKIVRRRRGNNLIAPVEVTCAECVEAAAHVKASHKAALDQARADEHAARDKRRELQKEG